MLKTNIRPPSANFLIDMPMGTIVKDMRTTYGNEPILWKVIEANHEGYPENSVTLASHYLLTIKPFDAKEPESTDAKSAAQGNARYMLSNIRSWANSDAPAGEWFTASHIYDKAPEAANCYNGLNPYESEAGFLNAFSPKFKASLMPTTLTCVNHAAFGGGMDEFTDKIFLASMAEMGLVNYQKIDEGTKLGLFTNDTSDANRIAYPTEYCVSKSDYKISTLDATKAWGWWLRTQYANDTGSNNAITQTGGSTSTPTWRGIISFRPFCNLPAKTRVSAQMDTDGAYCLF